MRLSRSADNQNEKVGETISERVTKFPCDEILPDKLTVTNYRVTKLLATCYTLLIYFKQLFLQYTSNLSANGKVGTI